MKKITLLIALVVSFFTIEVNAQITTYPYFEDFESGDGGWVADNTVNGSWALGTPAATVINSAADGTNAWMTNLTGDYNTNEDSFVTSPVFDFSTLAAPSIEFSIWWNSEFSWDGMVLQSSIDSGGSWQNVGAFGDPNNWFTDNTINGNPGGQQEGWTGRDAANGSGGWVIARHALTGLAGEANVLLRFAFGSDGSVQDDGIAFDAINVFEVACPEPLNITVDAIVDVSAEISWLAGGTETTWEVVVQAAGTGVPAGSGTSTMTNAPYNATGLTASTAYEVYVRADCGGGEFSSWVGPINFNTTNVPPPAPVGVTCTTGTSSFIFTEDFEDDPAIGWTGTTFSGANGDWDITPGNANSFGTGPFVSFSGGSHLEYEASGDSSTIASAVSPAIDLSAAVDGAELSFNMHAFGADMGTLNVGVGTDAAGPFTTVYTWIGDFQATDDEAWVPIGVNLDAYLGQTIYIEFSYGGAGTGFEGDMSIDFVRVEACGDFCIAPSALNVTGITDTTADINWTPSGGETEWEYVVQPAGTGAPAGAGTSVTATTVNETGLTATTAYEVYVRAVCGPGIYSSWTGPVNFTTDNTPPPAPVGVTCTTGTSTFIFTEDFEADPPIGWTGTTFSGANGDWDITPGNANSFGTGPFVSFSGGSHLEYEASGDSTTIVSAISPAIDLTTAVDGAELSFNMHAFGADMGTLNVGVGTAAAGPFTNVYTWIGNFQTADTDAWVPIGVNLDAYLGQTIYLEFSYGGAGTGFEGDMSIDFVRVETCGNFCIAPTALNVTGITDTTADINWTPSGGETEWEYVVQPAGTGEPAGAGTSVTATTVNETGLTGETDYEVYVRAVCAPGVYSVWTGPVNFTTPVQTNFTVDCAVGPVNTTYCYTDGDTTAFTYTSSDGSNLVVSFNAGEVENTWDELIILDSDGVTELYNGYGAAGDLTGLVFESTGDSIIVSIQADGIISCDGGGFTPWDFDVICLDPTAPPTCVSLIAPADGAVDVEVDGILTWTTSIGDPGGYLLFVGTTPGGTDVVNGLDVGVVTTFDLNTVTTVLYSTTYYVTILPYNANGLATGCLEESFTTRSDPNQVFNIVCASGPVNGTHCYDNNDDTTFLFTSDTGFPVVLTFNAGGIEAGDDTITIYDGPDNTAPVLYTGDGDLGNLAGLTVESTGDSLFMEINADGFLSCATGGIAPVWDFTAECLTCFKPTLAYNVTDDCLLDQFVVDVEITDAGDVTNFIITDDQGSPAQTATGLATVTFGPYAGDIPVTFTITDADDAACVVVSAPVTQGFCPDAECDVISAGFDVTQLCTETSTDLSAAFMQSTITTETTTYIIGEFDCPAEDLVGTPTSITTDDTWSDVINIGFDFEYYGTVYNQLVVGGNGIISFDTGLAGGFCPWAIDPADLIPSPGLPLNSIFGAYHDIHPGIGGNIEFSVVGTAPTRQFKLTFFEVPMFSCTDLLATQQIILYETSNAIAVNLIEKPTCAAWNGGLAMVGIQNATGTVGLAAPGRNTGLWDITEEETWIFLPDGVPNYTFEWFDEDGTFISNDTDITVSPTETTTYTASITYALASGSLVTVTDDVTVTVQQIPELTVPGNIEVCDEDADGIAEFDLTTQDATIIGTELDVTVSYYESLADAEAGTGAITDPATFENTTPSVQDIWIRLENNTTACFDTGSFQVIVNPKPILTTPDPMQSCDVDGDGSEIFDLTTQNATIIGTETDVTVSYYTSMADAEAGTPAIADPTNYTSSSPTETVYIRLENNTTGCYEVGSFDVIIITPPVITTPPDLDECDDDFDGLATFDMSDQEAIIIGSQTGVTVSYHETMADAESNTAAITDVTSYTSSTGAQTIYIRLENDSLPDCYSVDTFDLLVNLQIDPADIGIDGLCVDGEYVMTVSSISGSFDTSVVTYQWLTPAGASSTGDTNSQFVATVDGEYTVEVTTADGCTSSQTFNVINAACIFPEGISPGRSIGFNDTFDLRAFDVEYIEIFNVHGRSIYSKRDYTNEWIGQSSDRKELPVGTYFYVLKLRNGQTKNGWVYLNK